MEPIPSRAASRREPMFNVPLAVLACIGGFLAVHGLRELLSPEDDFALLLRYAFIPGQWSVAWDPSWLDEAVRQAAAQGPPTEAAAHSALARFVLGQSEPHAWSVVSYALLHGSWGHVLLNSLWLAAFGTLVARRCGPWRFLVLGVASAVGGALAHGIANPLGAAPMIGASAAVSGMMAAAARFMFAASRPYSLTDPHFEPRQSLSGLVRNQQAAVFLGFWFVTNLLFGLAATPLGIVDAGIAWEAHIGGFLTGFLLFPVLDPVRR